MCKTVPVRTKAKLRDAVNDHMAMLEYPPKRMCIATGGIRLFHCFFRNAWPALGVGKLTTYKF